MTNIGILKKKSKFFIFRCFYKLAGSILITSYELIWSEIISCLIYSRSFDEYRKGLFSFSLVNLSDFFVKPKSLRVSVSKKSSSTRRDCFCCCFDGIFCEFENSRKVILWRCFRRNPL